MIIARTDPTPTTYTCRESITAVQSQSPAPPPPPGTKSYTTTFDLTEFPISEGGRWFKSNNPWTFVRTANGTAYGSNGITNSYDDSYAMLSGFDPDQTVIGVVQRNSAIQGDTHEIELRLRQRDDTNNAWGYEVLFSHFGGVQVFKWNGPWGSKNTPLSDTCSFPWTSASPLKTGDVIKARITGNRIEAWINDRQKACTTDNTYATGQPGIGFFIRPGGAQNLLTLSSVTVTSP